LHVIMRNAFSFCVDGAQVLHVVGGNQNGCKKPQSKRSTGQTFVDSVRLLAAKETSLSLKIQDLIKDALEAQEDIVLAEVSIGWCIRRRLQATR
jgi:hypothetical protein